MGNFLLRIPDELHSRLIEQAEEDRRSLNAQILWLCESGMRSRKRQDRATRAHRLPDDFTVTREMVAWVRAEFPEIDGKAETDKFCDHWWAAGGANARKVDWVRAWKNWMREAANRIQNRPTGRSRADHNQALVEKYRNKERHGADRS